MYRYAQIDIYSGACVSVSQLSGVVDADHMIPLGPDDDVQPGDIWDGETWTRPDPPEPSAPAQPSPEDRIKQLEDENAALRSDLDDIYVILADIMFGQ